MKKIIVALSIISALFLAGCDTKKNVNSDMQENNNNQSQENIANSGENTSGEIVSKNNEITEKEHINPYIKYSQNAYHDYIYINDLANDIEEINLTTFTIDELQILRNIPFAQKGHDFKNADLAEFFNNESWYQKIEGKVVTLSELSSDEQKILSMIDAQIYKHKEKENSIPKYQYDSKKEIVYSFCTYNNDFGRKFDFPYVNINSANVKELNDKIYNWAMPIILGTYFECESAGYKYYLNNDILTIIIVERCGYGGETGFHFNIDINTGDFISNLEILQRNGIAVEKILNLKDKLLDSKTPNIYETTLKEYYLKIGDSYDKFFGNDLLNNPSEWTLVYLDNEQKMHVILELPTLAGAAGVSQFIDCIVEFQNITLDLTQPISISELLERNKLEIQNNQEHELNLGEFKIGNNSGELSISVKNQLVVKINGNIVHEYEANLIDCATLVMFKNYIICTDNYDFAGGYAYVFNEYGEKVYEFFTDHEKIEVENDVLLYSIYQGKLLEKSEEGIGTFARGHYELREENGVFIAKLINIDENDLNNFTIID